MKNPLRNFPRTLADSLRRPAFYRGLAEKGRLAPAFGHFAIIALLLSLLVGTVPVMKASLFLSDGDRTESFRTAVLDAYPDELELTIRDGVASSNVEEPYFIPMPPAILEGADPAEAPALAVISTSGDISFAELEEYHALIGIGRGNIVMPDEDGGVTSRPIGQTLGNEEIVVSEGALEGLLDTALRIGIPVLRVLVLFIPIFIFASLLPTYLIYLLFGALLVMIVANIRGEKYGYAQSYRAALYLITVPMTYGVLTSLWLFPQYRSPFIVSILLVIMAVGLVRKAPERTAPTEVSEVTEKKDS